MLGGATTLRMLGGFSSSLLTMGAGCLLKRRASSAKALLSAITSDNVFSMFFLLGANRGTYIVAAAVVVVSGVLNSGPNRAP